MKLAPGSSVLSALLVTGCLGGALPERAPGAMEDEAPLPEWVRCWISPDDGTEPDRPRDHLMCQWTKSPDDAGVSIAHVFVQVSAGAGFAESQMLERWPGQPVEMMAIGPAEYPVRVGLQLLVGRRPVGMETLSELRTTTTIESAAAATADEPWIVRQPFATWAVTLDVQTPIFEGLVFRTDVPLAPFSNPFVGAVYQAAGRTPLGRAGDRMTLQLAAPAGTTAVQGEARLGRDETRVPFAIDGPGAWQATPTGLVRAPPPDPESPADDAPVIVLDPDGEGQ